jgi:protease I
MTASPSISDDVRNAGGLYRDQPTVQDGHWITARGPADMLLFNRAVIEKLSTALGQPV